MYVNQDSRIRLDGDSGVAVKSYQQGEIFVEEEPSSNNSAEASASFSAPLAVFGLNFDYAIKPGTLLGAGFKYFTLHSSNLSRSIVTVTVNTRYYFWDHFESRWRHNRFENRGVG